MKNKLLLTLLIILIALTCTTATYVDDNNVYHAELPQVIVRANEICNFTPKRTRSQKEFIESNQPLINYVARKTWMTRAQVFALLRMEQGNGSFLFTKHNNPFNVKGRGVKCSTWEYIPTNRETHSFRSYVSIEQAADDFITLINSRYAHEPTDNITACRHIYLKGYHTDPNYYIRVRLANNYDKFYSTKQLNTMA